MSISANRTISGDCARGWRQIGCLGGALLAFFILSGHSAAQEAILTVPPRTAPNKEFEVGWIGPDATGDFIAIAGQGAPATSFLDYARTGAGNPARLTAPDVGDYEVRYISATTLSVLARLPLSVMIGPAQSAITAPPEVEAGADVMVSVTDAGEPADYLTIVAAGHNVSVC